VAYEHSQGWERELARLQSYLSEQKKSGTR